MKSFPAEAASRSYSDPIQPALTSFSDEVCANVARLFAYVGVLALFGILGVHAWDQLQAEWVAQSAPVVSWATGDPTPPVFGLDLPDAPDKSSKTKTYVVLRHPLGGRKDILRWSGTGEKPLAELEIYRPRAEYGPLAAAGAGLTGRMPAPGSDLEAADVIESKFGSVILLRAAGGREDAGNGTGSCLGFFKRIDDPALQISGWSCQGDGLPARRAAIDCMLSRLMLLSAGNEPKLAGLFARAELQRGSCASPAASTDWLTAAEDPRLRGTL